MVQLRSGSRLWWSLLAAVVLLGLATACGGGRPAAVGSAPAPPSPQAVEPVPPGAAGEPSRGGTLRVGLTAVPGGQEVPEGLEGRAQYGLDPQVEYDRVPFEIFRCCLLRTLLSYSGRPTAEGGAQLRPDLAAELPTVSADGLAWTFRLKPGLRYAPPYEETEIVAADVIRAVERGLRPAPAWVTEAVGQETIGSYPFFYAPLIVGTEEFAAGAASSISGLEAPDDHTLVVHLSEPAGDFGHRFTLPATAPIPPGAADGHDDGYGTFLVASGPYTVERFVPGSRISLVRNPSWSAASDDLRAALVDRIEISAVADERAGYAKVESGDLDLVLDAVPPPELVERYRGDVTLSSRLLVVPQDIIVYAAMNLAQPPFDDVHVRRAANLVVDKARVVALYGTVVARTAAHVAPDSLEGGLLLDYDPYRSHGNGGDLTRARAEMAQSRYDSDGDGRCDGPACTGIPAIAFVRGSSELFPPGMTDLLAEDLRRLGLELDVRELGLEEGYAAIGSQEDRYGIVLNAGWAKDFPNASSWFPPLLDGDDPVANISLVGMDAERLAVWGYPVTQVPSVGREVADCMRQVGGAQTRCWAALDQRVMEQIVPWIPIAQPNETRIVSGRVASTSIDQLTNLLSLDRIGLEPGSG